MPIPFADRLPLSRGHVDRDHLARRVSVDELLAEPGAGALVLHDGRFLGAGEQLLWLDAAQLPEGPSLFLGRDRTPGSTDDVPPRLVRLLDDEERATHLAADVAAEHATETHWISPRESGAEMTPSDAAFATEALALANWHKVTRHSPATGSPVDIEQGGWVLRDAEGREHFPRTDAAIIVAVTDDRDRLLLGSNAMWESRRFSLLAGFVEPGESFEQAVVREVLEESGVLVTEPEYRGSQPWPFPASIMVGFRARLADASPRSGTPDGEEILELRWFSRDELQAAVLADELLLPGRVSIARALLEEWFGGPIAERPTS